jgi:hypothetical protein
MALAHLISLIDLSGPEFASLRYVVEKLASTLYTAFQDGSPDEEETDES